MKTTKMVAIAIATVALAMTSCDNKKFQITGNIANATDSTLYLENIGLDGVNAIDSVKLKTDGQFTFAKKATTAPEFYRLRIAGQIINLSIDSTETVSVNADYATMSRDYTVEGSENCSKIKELALLQMQLQANVNRAIQDPTLNVAGVQQRIDALMAAYKTNVKENYIFKEPNKSYAYFALFQTLVVGYQQSLIFNPRTSEDDVKVFAAVATSWDAFHPNAERGKNLHNIAIEGMKNVRILRAQQNQTIDADKVDTSGILDVVLKDNKGNVRRLSEFKGKVVILDFCSLAQEGVTQRIMQMREVYNKYHAQGLEIFQVSLDTNEHFWKTQTAALPWVSVNDPAGAQSQYISRFNLVQIPTFFIIGKDSTPHKRDAQIKDLDAEIRALL